MQINQIPTKEWSNFTGPGNICVVQLASANSGNFIVDSVMRPTDQLSRIGRRADYQKTAIHE